MAWGKVLLFFAGGCLNPNLLDLEDKSREEKNRGHRPEVMEMPKNIEGEHSKDAWKDFLINGELVHLVSKFVFQSKGAAAAGAFSRAEAAWAVVVGTLVLQERCCFDQRVVISVYPDLLGMSDLTVVSREWCTESCYCMRPFWPSQIRMFDGVHGESCIPWC